MKRTKMLAILVVCLVLMVCLAKVSQAEPMGTAWTYQGRLIDANSAADGLYDFQFKLFDDPNTVTGNQLGSMIDVNDVDVIEGYFTVELDFGSNVFSGDARWLDISVRTGDSVGGFTSLSPREEITPVPYASYARKAGYEVPFVLSGSVGYPSTLFSAINNDDGSAVRGESVGSSGAGVEGKHVDSGNWGWVGCAKFGVWGQAESGTDAGVMGDHHESGSYGILGRNLYGVYGYNGSSQNYGYIGGTDYAVYGQHDTSGNYGYIGDPNYGVYGKAVNTEEGYHYGGYFIASEPYDRGVYGRADGNDGVAVRGYASGENGMGVFGNTAPYRSGIGVYGQAHGPNSRGVYGTSAAGGVGVYGQASGTSYAGYFSGRVHVDGTLTATAKSFVQPHPTDPSKQIVYVCLEGGENGVYVRGSGQLDAGRAEIELPEHFGLIASEKGLTAYVTPRDGKVKGYLYVEQVIPGKITVVEAGGGTSDARFDYLVMGVRRGYEEHTVIQEKRHLGPSREMSREEY